MIQDNSISGKINPISDTLSAYDIIKQGVENGTVSATSGVKLDKDGRPVVVDDVCLFGKEYYLAADYLATNEKNPMYDKNGRPYGEEILDGKWSTEYNATEEFFEGAGIRALANLKDIYQNYRDDAARRDAKPLTASLFFGQTCPQDEIYKIQALFKDTEGYKVFDNKKFNRYMADESIIPGFIKKAVYVGGATLLTLGLGGTAAAVHDTIEQPHPPETMIHDWLDPLPGGPSISADYPNLGDAIQIPINVVGYGLDGENEFDICVLNPNGDVVWSDVFIPGGNSVEEIIATIPAGAIDGIYQIVIDLDNRPSEDNLLTVDEFGITTAATPDPTATPTPDPTENPTPPHDEIPEFPTVAVPIGIILGIMGLTEYQKRKRQK